MISSSKILGVILFAIIAASCSSTNKSSSTASGDKELITLENIMAGKYTSEAQSKVDTNYFNISLVMVPIWQDRGDGKWMYVEQAIGTKLDKPYRQRVYHLYHKRCHAFCRRT
jgi:CpeT protein